MVSVIKPFVTVIVMVVAAINAQQSFNFRQEVRPTTKASSSVLAPSTPTQAPVLASVPAPGSLPALTMAPAQPPLPETAPVVVAAPSVDSLPVGAYFRPTGAEVSGQVGATTPFVRSPCPALNTLANHGFFPRNGRQIKKDVFVSVLMEVFNLDRGLASFHATLLKATTDLSDLGKHNFIEHDFSIVHGDSFYQGDPAALDMNFAADLLGRAVDGVLGVPQFAATSVSRMATCNAKPTGCKLSSFHRSLAFREQASILRVFGGANSETCRVDFAQSFLVDERIHVEWRKPAQQVRLADLSATGNNIQKAMKAMTEA